MEIRPILSALLRQKTGPLLVAIQVAISLAILANALFIVSQRIATADRPSGVAAEADVGYLTVRPLEKRPHAEVLVAANDGATVAFALYFHNFSTFEGKPGVYLEDLFVRPEARGSGLGKALLKRLAAIAIERDCARLEWWVLDWNEPAIQFYQSLGATPMDEWTTFRVDGDALTSLAGPT